MDKKCGWRVVDTPTDNPPPALNPPPTLHRFKKRFKKLDLQI